ncbi:MAG: hypothetical protein JWQ12_669 [Glaciihabitans sp.]|nr:hypothetical protein [Glaciihabitans sp.]
MSSDAAELANLFTDDLFNAVLDTNSDADVADLFAALADLDGEPAFDWSPLHVEDSIESARGAKFAAARGIASIAVPAPDAREQWIEGGRRLGVGDAVFDDALWELFASEIDIEAYRAEHPSAQFTIMPPDNYAEGMGPQAALTTSE